MKRKNIATINFVIIILLSNLVLLNSCAPEKRKAKGMENEIYVVADSAEFYEFEPELWQIFGKVIHTPRPEHLFDLKRVSINNLEIFQRQKNIIIIAPLDSKSFTSQYVSALIDSSVREQVLMDSAFVFNKYDLWAKDQLVMVLTSPTSEQLKKNLLKEEENLLYYFRNISNKRMGKNLFNPQFERKGIEANFLFNYDWMIYAQADYQIAMEKTEDNFVWLRREVNSEKERWVFVHWIENASPAFLKSDSIYNRRNALTQKYFQLDENEGHVVIAYDFINTSEVNFNGKYALFTQGIWQFSDASGGGPFINYTFYDEKSNRVYMLDASLWAPKYQKRSMLQQLDVLLHSFQTIDEVSDEKKADLQDYYKK